LLGHITTIIRTHENTKEKVADPKPTFSDETLPIPYELVPATPAPLRVAPLLDAYAKLEKEDQAMVSELIVRLTPKADPRAEAIERLLDMAAKIESDIKS
jgi:hypothetical protein